MSHPISFRCPNRRLSILAVLGVLGLGACATPPPATTESTTTAPAAPAATAEPAAPGAAAAAGEEEHEHKAPHGGTLVEIGDEFAHLELVVDRETGRLTAYILDGEAERAVRLAQPGIAIDLTSGATPVSLQLAPVASALTGERAGDTSEFALVRPDLFKTGALRGRVREVTVKGQTFKDLEFSVP